MTGEPTPPPDFEEILFESIPVAPTEFRAVAETFISRTQLSPGEARTAFLGVILAMLMPEDRGLGRSTRRL